MADRPTINLALLRDEVARHQPAPGQPRIPWLMRRGVTAFAVFYAMVFALPGLLSGERSHAFTSRNLSVQLGLSLLFGVAATGWSLRASRGSIDARVERSAHALQRDWMLMTRGRWVVRVILIGMVMAACIGLTVGTLIAIRPPHGELVAGSRLLTVLAFFAMTLAWCIPFAFGFRWFYLRWARPFIVAA